MKSVSRLSVLAALPGLCLLLALGCQEKPVPTEEQASTPAPADEGANPPAPEGEPEMYSAGHDETWCYDVQKPCGPEHWGSLNPDWIDCSIGKSQSPIAIVEALPGENAPALTLTYKSTPVIVANSGHDVEVRYLPGSTLDIGNGQPFELRQFHFHNPSENATEGERGVMEVHLVHARPAAAGKDSLAVIGLIFDPGDENAFLAQFWDSIPDHKGEKDAGVSVNVADLLPQDLGYYSFQGSLTTPGCGEDVHWYVLRQRVTASPEQVAKLNGAVGENARPLQPANGRTIVTGPAAP